MRELTDEQRRAAYRFADVALPTDAIDCEAWEWHGGNDWRRYFVTHEWVVAGLWVSVVGEQNQHGDVVRWMHVGGEDQCSTSDRQELIAALVAAGRLLDALTEGDGVGARPRLTRSAVHAESRYDGG